MRRLVALAWWLSRGCHARPPSGGRRPGSRRQSSNGTRPTARPADREGTVPAASTRSGVPAPAPALDSQRNRIQAYDPGVFEECMRTRGYERVPPAPSSRCPVVRSGPRAAGSVRDPQVRWRPRQAPHVLDDRFDLLLAQHEAEGRHPRLSEGRPAVANHVREVLVGERRHGRAREVARPEEQQARPPRVSAPGGAVARRAVGLKERYGRAPALGATAGAARARVRPRRRRAPPAPRRRARTRAPGGASPACLRRAEPRPRQCRGQGHQNANGGEPPGSPPPGLRATARMRSAATRWPARSSSRRSAGPRDPATAGPARACGAARSAARAPPSGSRRS